MTAAFEAFVTLGVNVCVCDERKVALVGDRDTPTLGTRVKFAVANFVGSAKLATVTVMVWVAVMVDGAV